MDNKFLILLLFLLLALIIIFGGYFISTKINVDNKIININKNYDSIRSQPIVINEDFSFKDNFPKINKDIEENKDLDNEGKSVHKNKPVECYDNFECGIDYDEESYCIFDRVYKKVHTFECNSQCSEDVDRVLVENCLMGCSDGKCINSFPYECSYDYECGFDDFTGDRYCSENNVHQKFITWSCENPGTENSSCKIDISDKLVDECVENLICSSGMCVE